MFRLMFATAALLVIASFFATAQEIKPSFDCAKAVETIDHAICADASLAALDAELAAHYKEALSRTSTPDTLRKEQLAWAGERANACGILPGVDDDVPDFSADQITCLKDNYAARISALMPAMSVKPKAGDAGQLLNGLWQISELVEVTDPTLEDIAQREQIIHLTRYGLTNLGGGSCAGPLLETISQAQARPLDPDGQALIDRVEKLSAPAEMQFGVAGICLGRLFAIYVPARDGTLLVADDSAIYRLMRPGLNSGGAKP